MNSFLFNIMLVLIASVSVTQFCSTAFQDYASMTDIDLIFSTQVKYLKFFSYFFKNKVFEYSFIGIIGLSTLYLLCRPSDVNSLKDVWKENKISDKQVLTLNEEKKDVSVKI